MNDSVGNKTKKSLYWNVVLKIPYEVFRFGISIVIARLLDPKDFGIVSIATMAIFYSNSFTNFGFNQALIQKKEISSKHINSVFTFDVFISAVLSVVIFLASSYIAGFFNSPESEDVIKLLSVVFILTALHDLPYVLLRRDIEFKLISIVDMFREVSMSLITLGLAYYGFQYWSIVWGYIVPLFFASLYLLYKVKYPFNLSYNHESIKELFNFSFWSFIQMQIYFLSSRVDRIIIGKFINTATLGIYEKSKSLSQMPSESLGDKINTVLFSSFSRVQNDKEQIQNLFSKGLVIMSSINFPIYFGMYAVAEHFVLVLLGEKWQAMISPFQIMAFAGIIASINGLLSALAVGSGHFKKYTIYFGLSTSVLLIGSYLVVDYGISAIAGVLVLYTFVLFYLSYTLVKKAFDLHWATFFLCVSPAFISGVIMVFVIEIFKSMYLFEISIINLLILIMLGIFSYSLIMMIIPSSSLNSVRKPIYRDLNKLWLKIRKT